MNNSREAPDGHDVRAIVRAWGLRLAGLFGKEGKDRELAAELESHLQMHIEDNMRRGMTPEAARRDALMQLGGLDQTKERVRERRGLPLLESLLQDVRFGLRMLRKSPGFTVVAVLTLALGIGANTAIFSVVNSLILRPLPVPRADQIMTLAAEQKDATLPNYGFSYLDYEDFRKQASGFSDLFGYYPDIVGLTADNVAQEIEVSDVTGNYFSGLGVKPVLGRLIDSSDDQPGGEPHVVLGYSYWQKRFGGDPGVSGKRILINGKPATIIGVAPKNFYGLFWSIDMDAYLPFAIAPSLAPNPDHWLTDRSDRRLLVFGRLGPDASRAEAQSSLDVISQRLAEEYPTADAGFGVRVYPERWARPRPYRNNIMLVTAGLFIALASVLLLLASLNVANLLLARGSARQQEFAIRCALGSGTARLMRQLLTETMLLGILGGALGYVLGRLASNLMGSVRMDQHVPVRLDFSFDWRVFAYALGSAVATGVLVGMVPALRSSRTNLNTSLREGGSRGATSARHRTQRILVALQIAGSMALLVAAGLFIRSLWSAERAYLGFDPEQVLNVGVNPGQVGYEKARTTEFFRRLEENARALPGVRSVALAWSVPMGDYAGGHPVYIEEHPPVRADQTLPFVTYNRIDSNYFETMRVQLLRGRGISATDGDKAPLVAVINQTMAARFWPGEDAVGKRFSVSGAAGPFLQVIGIAADGKYLFIAEPPQPFFYVPLVQNYSARQVLEIRSSSAPEELILPAQQMVHSLDPAVPVSFAETMNESLQQANGLFLFRFGASLATAMGITGLMLAVLGIYGLIAYTVSQRTREIGVRISLGATAADVVRLILRQGLVLVLPGMAIGLALALLLTHAMASLLFGVSATDPFTYGVVAVLLFIVGLLASLIPARRAAKVDPIVALRYE